MKMYNIPTYYQDAKPMTKQMPLFEEQDDGNLLPYEREE